MRYEFGQFFFDAHSGQLLREGVEVPLNRKAAAVLRILVEDCGNVVKKDDIIDEVWSDSFVEESNLTQHIYTLRKALGQTASQVTYIETVPKSGYRFNPRVNVLPNGNGNGLGNGNGKVVEALPKTIPSDDNEVLFEPKESEAPASIVTTLPDTADISTRLDPKFRPSLKLVAYSLLGCILITASALIFYRYPNVFGSPGTSRAKSIAVIPFRSLDGSEDPDKLGLGMADAVITKLGKLQQIQVRPTSSVFDFASKQMADPISAGRSLGVDTVLDGTLQRVDGKVRVTVQLISISDEKTLWSDSFNEDFTDVFKVQDVIAERVARAFMPNLDDNQKRLLGQRATSNIDAYKAYTLGVYFWSSRNKDALVKGIDYFKQAIELDPDYAYAYAGLADSYAMMGYYQYDEPSEMFQLAKQTANHALTLDDTVAEAYIALAQVQKHFEHDNDASRLSLERAIELSPYNATAHQRYSWQLIADKKIVPAVSEMRLAHEYNPISPIVNTALCQILSYRGEREEAIAYCKNANEIDPNSSVHLRAYADVLFFSGQTDDAIGMLETAVQKNKRDQSWLIRLAYFYAKTGRRDEAFKIYRELRAEESDDSRRFIHFANLAFALGEEKESYALLQQAAKNCAIPFDGVYDPIFADLRSDDSHGQIFIKYYCGDSSR